MHPILFSFSRCAYQPTLVWMKSTPLNDFPLEGTVAVTVTATSRVTWVVPSENEAVRLPAATVIELGKLVRNDGLSALRLTTRPPAGAGKSSVTVHVLFAPPRTDAGTNTTELTPICDTVRFTLAVFVIPARVAVRTIVWFEETVAVWIVNVAVD